MAKQRPGSGGGARKASTGATPRYPLVTQRKFGDC